MIFGRNLMINQLMNFESAYIADNLREHPTHTKESWERQMFAEYQSLSPEQLAFKHRELLDGYYSDEEDFRQMFEDEQQALLDGTFKDWMSDFIFVVPSIPTSQVRDL